LVTRRMFIVNVLAVMVSLSSGCSGDESSGAGAQAAGESHIAVTIKGETFNLELALDDDTRLQGLSDRTEIAADGGMLFVFTDEARRQFVMRRCLVPIDLAYLDAQGEIVWMHAMQVEDDPDKQENLLKRYNSHHPAQFAVEVRDGSLRRLGLRQGDRIELPLEELKGRAR
jgi:uncharacterized membrane protein (UPF0127 family)